ncbi:MAG: hypothetical protein WCR24_05865 [Candidatus Methanomethylophilaceae archaeon]
MAFDDARSAAEKFCNAYDGAFGKFNLGDDCDRGFATATHELKSRYTSASIVMFSVEDDISGVYSEKVEFVKEKSKPTVMGKPTLISKKFGFDEEYGTITNFSMMGQKGGFVYYAAHTGKSLMCAQLFSLQGNISDDDLSSVMRVIIESAKN